MKTQTLALLSAVFVLAAGRLNTEAANVSFGSFSIEFVEIGNAGNAQDGAGTGDIDDDFGDVGYAYRIGVHEISEDMIDKANTAGSLGITHDGRGADKPATSISWFEAATFVNWLNTSSGGTAAYKFDVVGGTFALWESGDTGFDASNPYRNGLATYWLPSVDEWYKAAYYDPVDEVYYDYATGSDSVPDGIDFSGDTSFDAVFNDGFNQGGPNDITNGGVLSPYGTMAQNGNVFEWEETALNLGNDSTGENRGIRGGEWIDTSAFLLSSFRNFAFPTLEGSLVGFRVAGVIPEPSRAVLALVGMTGVLLRRRRPVGD